MSEQYADIVKQILEENRTSLMQIELAKVETFLQLLESNQRIFVTGEGRSGLVIRMLAMRLTHLGRSAFVVGDATTPAIRKEDLLVVCSGSGETPIPCMRAERTVKVGATVVALCGREDSRLTRSAQLTILLPPPMYQDQSQQKRTVQFGGSRFEQSAFLFCDLLAYLAMQRWRVDPTEMQARHANLE